VVTSGRVVLVTGANRGIGKEVARQLARAGAHVLLGSRCPVRGAEAAAELATDGVEVVPLTLDVTDEAGVAAAVDRIGADHGRLDSLVNNAGVFVGAPAVATTAHHLRQLFEVNVFGVVTVVNTMLPLLLRSARPCIVNVSSTTASLALTGAGAELPGDPTRRMAYTSSKAALNMLTVQYARAFAADADLARIRINAVSPGYTATDMNDFTGDQDVSVGARAVVRLATLSAGPTGGFFGDQGPLPW